MPVGDGTFRLYINGLIRRETEIHVGDWVRLAVWRDLGYMSGPQHPMPRWLRIRIASDPRAKDKWDSLAPSAKKEILRYIAGVRTAHAKEVNMERAYRVLSGEKGRFLGRAWNDDAG